MLEMSIEIFVFRFDHRKDFHFYLFMISITCIL
jgi:hypothetical protein